MISAEERFITYDSVSRWVTCGHSRKRIVIHRK